jgi:hypothetical protein
MDKELRTDEVAHQDRNRVLRDRLVPLLREVEDSSGLPIDFYCECHNRDCRSRIELTMPAYERAHRRPGRFVVKPHHVAGPGDRVVERHPTYWLVELDLAWPAPALRGEQVL